MVDKTEERQLREQQLESWGRLLAGLSHDLKNHLGIIVLPIGQTARNQVCYWAIFSGKRRHFCSALPK